MIGPVGSYQDLYVASCGDVLANYGSGKRHERECQACRCAEAKRQMKDKEGVDSVAPPCLECGGTAKFVTTEALLGVPELRYHECTVCGHEWD